VGSITEEFTAAGSLIAVFSNDVGGNPQQVVFGLLTMLLAG
jgi:hypothetical protein